MFRTQPPAMIYAVPSIEDEEMRVDLAARIRSGELSAADARKEVERYTQPLVMRIERAMRGPDRVKVYDDARRAHLVLLEMLHWLSVPIVDAMGLQRPEPIIVNGVRYEYDGPWPP
jgi:hypothetical protein